MGDLPRIRLSWSAPSHTLSSTSSGAHALICCRGHRPLKVCSLSHALSSTSSGAHALICSRGHRPLEVCSLPHTLSSTRSGAPTHICCRGHRPLEVCSLPHTLSHLPAVVLMRSSAVVDIVLSRSAPSPHSLSSTSRGAHALICYRGHPPLVVCPLPHTLSSTSCGALPSGGESSVSLALPRARE